MMRKAVGALAVSDGRLLLVRKVLLASAVPNPVPIEPEWGFPKGGIATCDASLECALMRELAEETGSDDFSIVCRLEQPFIMSFDHGPYRALPFVGQETVMYLVEFWGDPSMLAPQDEEIDNLAFFELTQAIAAMGHAPACQYLQSILAGESWCCQAVRDRLF